MPKNAPAPPIIYAGHINRLSGIRHLRFFALRLSSQYVNIIIKFHIIIIPAMQYNLSAPFAVNIGVSINAVSGLSEYAPVNEINNNSHH